MESRARTLPQGADRKALLGLTNCLDPPPQKPPSFPPPPQVQLEQPGSRPHTPQSGPTADQPTESSGPDLSSRVPSRPASGHLRPVVKSRRPAKRPRAPSTLTYLRPPQQQRRRQRQRRLPSPGGCQKRLPTARCTLGNVVLYSDPQPGAERSRQF